MRPDASGCGPVVALAGGVGAARFLSGLVRAVAPENVAAIVNTGDDRIFYGVHVSPDVDIVTYTLADRVDRARGYGLEGDTYAVIDALGALGYIEPIMARLGPVVGTHAGPGVIGIVYRIGETGS